MKGRVRIEGELKCMICQEINICGSVHAFVSVCKCVCVCVCGGGCYRFVDACLCVCVHTPDRVDESACIRLPHGSHLVNYSSAG